MASCEQPPFVHLDVISAYSTWCSPTPPEGYVRALARQYPLSSDGREIRPALAIADYGYVLESGQIAVEGESASLAANPRVAAAYLGQAHTARTPAAPPG